MVNKLQTLNDVRNKLQSMYDSYNPIHFSEPNQEIPEEIAKELTDIKDYKYWDKVLTIVRYIWDDTIENLYFNGIGDSFHLEGISQSDLDSVFQTIINNQNK